MISCSVLSVTTGAYVPKWLFNSARYETHNGYKIMGKKLYEGNVPLEDCIKKCDDDRECMSVVYRPSKTECSTHPQSRESDPDSYTQWDGYDYYGKLDVYSRFPVQKIGYMDDSGFNKVFEGITSRECLMKCVNNVSDGCKGFNYSNSQKCVLVPSIFEGNEVYFSSNDTNNTFYSGLN